MSKLDDQVVELDYLFVEPAYMNRGVGSKLFNRAVSEASNLGFSEMSILSDPYATDFYRARGARFIEYRPSDAIEGRKLPFFIYSLGSCEVLDSVEC